MIIGCVSITDPCIKELQLLAVEARSYGQEKIEVHIFSFKFSNTAIDSVKWSDQVPAKK